MPPEVISLVPILLLYPLILPYSSLTPLTPKQRKLGLLFGGPPRPTSSTPTKNTPAAPASDEKWDQVYEGSATEFVVEGLSPATEYK
jgi:hypothetical protein